MDFSLVQSISGVRGFSPFLDWGIIFFAEYLPYFLVIATSIFVLREHSRKERAHIFLVTLLTLILSRGIITETIRFFYHRPRPFVALQFTPLFSELHYAFPSGHAAFLFALACVMWSFNKTWGYWFFGFALLNGIARVLAGVHWPSDIVGGICVALISFFIISYFAEEKIFQEK